VSNERTHRVAVIGGDGIGRGHRAALDVVRAAGVAITTTTYELGAARYLKDGFVLDDATLEELRAMTPSCSVRSDRPSATPDSGGVLERGLLLRMRFGLDSISTTAVSRCRRIDRTGCEFAIVRENTEGPYAGEGGILRRGTRTRSRPRVRSTLASASNVACATAFERLRRFKRRA